jgi:uncharacterized protein (DUF1800 family)
VPLPDWGRFLFAFMASACVVFGDGAGESPELQVTNLNGKVRVSFPPLPHVASVTFESSTNLPGVFLPGRVGASSGNVLTGIVSNAAQFFRVNLSPISSNELLSAIILNRLTYGPTPDEIERIKRIGPQAYIDEQLAPETIPERSELEEYEPLKDGWEFVTQTGRATSSELSLMLWDGGAAFIDDIVLVRGSVPGRGENLVRNGDFEAPLQGEWEIGSEFRRSQIVSSNVHSGKGALMIMAEYSGDRRNIIRQWISPGLSPNETYTISYWYYRFAKRPNQFTLSLVGSSKAYGIFNSPDDAVPLNARIQCGLALPEDLRAWHARRAVLARRQLLEVLVQFLENHFVTGLTKSADLFGNVYDSGAMIYRGCAGVEINELQRWRAALLRPDCTFEDLLRVSIESPAMILYLDTYLSAGGAGLVPNENFARELMELFTMGSDNGYDQTDVTVMSSVWTGWSVKIVDYGNEMDPFAPLATNRIFGFEGEDSLRNLIGAWTFSFLPQWHDPSEKTLFHGKKVPERFGPPYAGKGYELRLPARDGRAGIQDGYDVAHHLADLPFTQEFISAKLCRLFVHDDFSIGYDFTSADLSPEDRLVRACMEAWENSTPKGNIRAVLRVIFNSALFRTKSAAFQKIKTPLEFTVSAIRALRSEAEGLGSAAEADDYVFDMALQRMGRMMLFDQLTPDGTPEEMLPMINASTITERIRFVQSLLCPAGPTRPPEAGISRADPVALVRRRLPEAQWTNDRAVVEYFLEILYFGHGKASLQPVRELALEFLNTSDGGGAGSFRELRPETAAYDERIRGMVALLMSLFPFNQQ